MKKLWIRTDTQEEARNVEDWILYTLGEEELLGYDLPVVLYAPDRGTWKALSRAYSVRMEALPLILDFLGADKVKIKESEPKEKAAAADPLERIADSLERIANILDQATRTNQSGKKTLAISGMIDAYR